jgi:hypothetical protein
MVAVTSMPLAALSHSLGLLVNPTDRRVGEAHCPLLHILAEAVKASISVVMAVANCIVDLGGLVCSLAVVVKWL